MLLKIAIFAFDEFQEAVMMNLKASERSRSKLEMIRILAGQSTSKIAAMVDFILFVRLFTDLSLIFS